MRCDFIIYLVDMLFLERGSVFSVYSRYYCLFRSVCVFLREWQFSDFSESKGDSSFAEFQIAFNLIYLTARYGMSPEISEFS